MIASRWRTNLIWLIFGDSAAVLVISAIGFATHNEVVDWRVYSTFLSFLASWVANAPWLGVYRPEIATDLRQAWRPALAAFLAAPMAAWLRGVVLGNRPILPVFVLALGASAALGMAIWRLIWVLIVRRGNRNG